MKIERGQAALITGAGSGIGRALAVGLAGRGVRITLVDLRATQSEETIRLVEEEHAKISYKPNSPSAIFIQCDVTKTDDVAAAFARHQDVFGQLDICINNAGIVSEEPFPETNPNIWRKVIEVNLMAVIDGTIKAIQAMKERGGMILNTASAAGFLPLPFQPIYSASKGGVLMFTRSLTNLEMDIRVNSLCPEFVETPLLQPLPSSAMADLRDKVGFVPMEKVVAAALSTLDDETKAGQCVWVPTTLPTQTYPDEETDRKYQFFMKDGSPYPPFTHQ